MPSGGRYNQEATVFAIEDAALACGGTVPAGMGGSFVLARRCEVECPKWIAELQPPLGLIVQAVGKDFSASKLSKSVVPEVCY